MKNKKQSVQNAEDDKHEAAKGEENEENCSCSTDFLSNEDARCPICLNCLVEQEVGFPENCNHIFCMTCILKWAEVIEFLPQNLLLGIIKDCTTNETNLILKLVTAARLLVGQYWKKPEIPPIEEWTLKVIHLAEMAKI